MGSSMNKRAMNNSVGRNVIAVIGIDSYHYWPKLTNAVHDAMSIEVLFKHLGFESVAAPLLDDLATGNAIQSLVTDDLMKLSQEDSLVLFYAGHGGTRRHRLGEQIIKTGYLLPVEAFDSSDKVSTWIDLEGWLRAISLLPARHILVILDACHSGIALDPILKWRDVTSWQDTPISILQERRSRRIITSALDDELALDTGPLYGHSLFAGCLIEGLKYGFRQNGSRIVTGSELGLYIQQRVKAYPNSKQTPDFGTFAFDDRGEMAILLTDGQSQDALSISVKSQSELAQPPDKILAKSDLSQAWHWIVIGVLGAIFTIALGAMLSIKLMNDHATGQSPSDAFSIDAGSSKIDDHGDIDKSTQIDNGILSDASDLNRTIDAANSQLPEQPLTTCPTGMVSIPGATFQMGSTKRIGAEDEHPQHQVTLSSYCIDKTEVTVKEYAACVNAQGCVAAYPVENDKFNSADTQKFYNHACNQGDHPSHPVNCVDWNQAMAFCAWANRRLPTEAEWEYAARGGDGRLYPWGNNEPNARRLNACGRECSTAANHLLDEDWMVMYAGNDGWITTAPVGSFPGGASPFGVLDMAGNVEEWTADWYGGDYSAVAMMNPRGAETGSERVVRGGAWRTHVSEYVRSAHRDAFEPTRRMSSLGFRCARSKASP